MQSIHQKAKLKQPKKAAIVPTVKSELLPLKLNRKLQLNTQRLNELIALLNAGQLDDCVSLATHLTESYPRNGLVWKILGTAYQKQSLNELAVEALEKAADLLPKDFEVAYNFANAFFDLNQLDNAILHYQRAISIAPNFFEAYFNLAYLYELQKDYPLAEAIYKQALTVNADLSNAYFALADLYGRTKSDADFVEAYQTILSDFLLSSEATLALAIEFENVGRHKESQLAFKHATSLKPDNLPELYKAYSEYFSKKGNLTKAIDFLRKTLEVSPNDFNANSHLGLIYLDQKQFTKSEYHLKKAIETSPDDASAYNHYGLFLYRKGELNEAEHYLKKALTISPNEVTVLNNLGLLYEARFDHEKAVEAFKEALRIQPNYVPSLINVALSLNRLGKQTQAIGYAQQGLAKDPANKALLINIAVIYQGLGEIARAVEANLKVIEQEAESMLAHNNLFYSLCLTNAYSNSFFKERLKAFGATVTHMAAFQYDSWIPREQKRIRVGFVSADFFDHPVGSFLLNAIKNINPQKFELVAYTNNAHVDEITISLKQYFKEWVSIVGLSDQDAAEKIHDDGIDLLIDLSGHTSGNRLAMFAYKPAPVQMTWLGYWDSTGVEQIDYILLDEMSAPPEMQDQFTETIAYIPETRFCYSPPKIEMPVSALPAKQNGFITFGAYHNYAKVSDDVLMLWAAVLRELPTSRLRWQTKAFHDKQLIKSVHRKFADLGVGANRIDLIGFMTRKAYLETYHTIDFILDCFPFSACTTTCDGLWMGVPTLTMPSQRLGGRQGVSLMTAVGLPEWVADSQEAFVSKAIAFASDVKLLANIRENLRQQLLKSAIGDANKFARNLEVVFEKIASKHTIKQIDAFNQVEQTNVVCLISATRMSETDFWEQSALGQSIKQLKNEKLKISCKIAFENHRGLSEIYNESILSAEEDATLIFIHDDVWIDDEQFFENIAAGLERFNVIGVTGNQHIQPYQPAWAFIDENLTWDRKENLSGAVCHGSQADGALSYYGPSKKACELLDGIFLAVKKQDLIHHDVYFDPQFKFHFYDLDFCRVARKAGLTLGTWPIKLTHQSEGQFGSIEWEKTLAFYFNKWETKKIEIEGAFSDELKVAIEEVIATAIEYQNKGNLEEASLYFKQVLAIQPKHAEVNYHLGFITAQTMSIEDSLPYFEEAVKANPTIEQYWVSYIDALTLFGAYDTAIQAIELGQKFGLKSETAVVLIDDLQTKQKEQNLLYSQNTVNVLSALNSSITPSLRKTVNNQEANIGDAVFYIATPAYTYLSSGVRCMHILCDELNKLGYEAYITTDQIKQGHNTPPLTNEIMQRHKIDNRMQIAVYPEVEMNNPLNAQHVVRFLLNHPNFFKKGTWFGRFHEDEYIINFPDFDLPWIHSNELMIQCLDRSVYRLPQTDEKRAGFLVYQGRNHDVDLSVIPEWCQPYEIISSKNPRPPEALAALYRQSEGIILFERSAAGTEAMLCGCPVIFSTANGLSKALTQTAEYEEYFSVWDFDREAFKSLQAKVNDFSEYYDRSNQHAVQNIKKIADDMISHFRNKRLDSVEITPKNQLKQYLNLLAKKDYSAAVLRLKQIITDFPQDVEAYFVLSTLLTKFGLNEQAYQVLCDGEQYLLELPEHSSLKEIRQDYYDLMMQVKQTQSLNQD